MDKSKKEYSLEEKKNLADKIKSLKKEEELKKI